MGIYKLLSVIELFLYSGNSLSFESAGLLK